MGRGGLRFYDDEQRKKGERRRRRGQKVKRVQNGDKDGKYEELDMTN